MPAGKNPLGVELEVAGREWKCGACGETGLGEAPEGGSCRKCGASVESRVTSYCWPCPECEEENYAPANPGTDVKCGNCRAVFPVSGVKAKKAKTKRNAVRKQDSDEIPFLPQEGTGEVQEKRVASALEKQKPEKPKTDRKKRGEACEGQIGFW